jgi:hypothetical protein
VDANQRMQNVIKIKFAAGGILASHPDAALR